MPYVAEVIDDKGLDPSELLDSERLARLTDEAWRMYKDKSMVLAYILWLFFGLLGVHRFYLGRFWTGLFLLCTSGGALLWWLLDLFFTYGNVCKYNDEQARLREAYLRSAYYGEE